MKYIEYTGSYNNITYKVKVDNNIFESLINKHYIIMENNGKHCLYFVNENKTITIDKYVLEFNKINVSKCEKTSHIDGDNNNYEITNIVYGAGAVKSKKRKFKGVVLKTSGVYTVDIRNTKLRIHVGLYKTEIEAAIAYNKAMDIIKGPGKYIENKLDISKRLYDEIYRSIKVDTTKNRHIRQGTNHKLEGASSIYTGVMWDKQRKKWHSNLVYKRKNIYLGRHVNEITAAQAYNEAVTLIYGEDAKINPVPKPLHPIIDIQKIRERIEKIEALENKEMALH